MTALQRIACIALFLLWPAEGLRCAEPQAESTSEPPIATTQTWGPIGGSGLRPPTSPLPMPGTALSEPAITQPTVMSGSFLLPGMGTVFRLHHTAGEQYGSYPSYTSFGGTQFLPYSGGAWLIDGQLLLDNHSRLGGSIDSIWRWARNETVWGIGLGADLTQTSQQHVAQGVLSLEMLRQKWGLRANGYLPFDTGQTTQDDTFTTFSLQNTSVVSFTTEVLLQEAAMNGIDVEFYRNLFDTRAELFAGSYAFESESNQTTGYKLGLRGNVTQDISANLQFTQDSLFGARLSGGLTWFFGPGQRTRRAADRRLTSLVQRNHYVSVDRETETATAAPQLVTDQLSGDPLNIFFASEAGSGSGTQASPTDVVTALADPNFGAGSVLILLDANGPLTTGISLTADRQQVLGAPTGDLTVDLSVASNQSGASLNLTGLGGRPVLSPVAGPAAIQLSSTGVGHVIAGLTLNGLGGVADGITDFDGLGLTFGATDTLIRDMVIRDFAGTGVLIQPSINTTIENTLFQNNGQDINLNAANTTLRNIVSSDSLGDSISLANTTGTTTIENVTLSNSGGSGLTLSNASGQVDINDLDVVDSGDAGVDIQGGDAIIHVDTGSSIADTEGTAFQVQGGSADVTFQGAISQASTGATVSVDGSHNGSLLFSQASIVASNGIGMRFQDAGGSYDFDVPVSLLGGASVMSTNLNGELTFADLFIDGPTNHGVFLGDHAGNFTITGELHVSNATGSAGVAVHDAQAGSSADFGATTIAATGAGTQGIDLRNNHANAMFTFRDLHLSTGDATGLRADQGGIVNFVGTAPEIAAIGGAAADLRATSGQHNGLGRWMFSQLSSTNSTSQGLRLEDLIDDFQVVGATSITNAAGIGFETLSTSGDILLTSLSVDGASTGIDLTDHTGSFTVSGVELLAGSGGQIQNVDLGARLENVAEATLRNMTLHGTTRGVEGLVNNGNDSSLSIQNSSVVGEVDYGIHFGTSVASTGTLSATLWNNDIEGVPAAVHASASGGDIDLVASENDFTSASATGVITEDSGGAAVNQTMNSNTVHNTSAGWVRDANPLLVAGALGSDGKRETVIADPDVVYDPVTGSWHLYYFAGRATTYGDDSDLELYIQHATSLNGTGWVLDAGQALSVPGDPTAWDGNQSETPSVLIDPTAPADRRFKLYYAGANALTAAGFPNYQLGLAFSADGSSFTRLTAAESPYGEDGAVLRVGEVLGHLSDFDYGVLADPEIKLINGTYNLWFSSFAADDQNNPLAFGISHATSADGINWAADVTSPIPSLLWPDGFGGMQPSVTFNSSLNQWETYFTSDTAAEMAAMPSTAHPSSGVWRSTSPDSLNWSIDFSGRSFNWDPDVAYEELGLLTGLEVVVVNDVRHIFYTGWSSVNPPPGFAVPVEGGFEPAVLTLLHATQSAIEN